jgi:ElaB/YqjD/DUF883 family membrane-anchored ribosome-binding protein
MHVGLVSPRFQVGIHPFRHRRYERVVRGLITNGENEFTFNMGQDRKTSRADTERALKEMQKDFEKRIDAVRTELTEKGPEAVEKSLNDLKASFEDKFSDMSENLESVRESLDDGVETGRTTIKERPLMAVGFALVFGVAIGLLFGRSKN